MIANNPFVIQDPNSMQGCFYKVFGNESKPIHLEIGCGKGRFITTLASMHPQICYIGIENHSTVLLKSVKKLEDRDIPNLRFILMDAMGIQEVFAPGEVDRIYLNFSEPWTRKKKPKRRLTYRDFLKIYEKIMVPGGQIRFKTDNTLLFEFSLSEFKECGFTLSEVTRDLHNSEYDKDNVRTEFEQKFAEQGIAIKRCVATSGKQKGSDNRIIA